MTKSTQSHFDLVLLLEDGDLLLGFDGVGDLLGPDEPSGPVRPLAGPDPHCAHVWACFCDDVFGGHDVAEHPEHAGHDLRCRLCKGHQSATKGTTMTDHHLTRIAQQLSRRVNGAPDPYCPSCQTYATDMAHLDDFTGKMGDRSARAAYVVAEDGTFDSVLGMFFDDLCYIGVGLPVGDGVRAALVREVERRLD